jgi:hypothetical protein
VVTVAGKAEGEEEDVVVVENNLVPKITEKSTEGVVEVMVATLGEVHLGALVETPILRHTAAVGVRVSVGEAVGVITVRGKTNKITDANIFLSLAINSYVYFW